MYPVTAAIAFMFVIPVTQEPCPLQHSAFGIGFPTGTIIKTVKVFKSGYAAVPSTESRVVVVATDETAAGGGHKVYFFNTTLTGEIILHLRMCTRVLIK
jgi:hypothetical protein